MAETELYVVIVELELLPAASKADAEALLSKNAAASFENEPGCLRFDVVEAHNDAAAFILYEIYSSESAFAEHLKTQHFLEFDKASIRYFGSKNIRLGALSTEASATKNNTQHGANDE